MKPLLLRSGIFGWLLALLLFAVPESTFAHTRLLASLPPPGADLTRPPSEIRLTFDEPILPGSTLTLTRGLFEAIPSVIVSIDPDAPDVLRAELPPLEPADYTVQWTVLSQDEHAVSGSYSFRVREARAAGGRGWWIGLAVVGFVGLSWWLRRRISLSSP